MICDDCPGGTDWEQRALAAEAEVEQVRRERDAAHEMLRNALVEITEALGLPLTEAGRPRANSFLYREIGRFLECHDWAWPPPVPDVPATPTPQGQT